MSREQHHLNPFVPKPEGGSSDLKNLSRSVLGLNGMRAARILSQHIKTSPRKSEVHALIGQEQIVNKEPLLLPGEFYMDRVESLEGLPGFRILKDVYGFRSIDCTDFQRVIPKTLLSWTEESLDAARIFGEDLRRMLLALPRQQDVPLVARVMNIPDLFPDIFNGQSEEDLSEEGGGHMTLGEILFAIDEAGYKPANFEIFLSFVKYFWDPEPDQNSKKKKTQFGISAQKVIALGSVYRRPHDGYAIAPQARYSSGKDFFQHIMVFPLEMGDSFLLVRK